MPALQHKYSQINKPQNRKCTSTLFSSLNPITCIRFSQQVLDQLRQLRIPVQNNPHGHRISKKDSYKHVICTLH